MGEDEKTAEFDIKLLEAQLYNFIFARARDHNDERAWTNTVLEVFGHMNFDDLPDKTRAKRTERRKTVK